MELNEMINMRNEAERLFRKNEGESTEMRQLERLIVELNLKIKKEKSISNR